jgi:hypothetical protein
VEWLEEGHSEHVFSGVRNSLEKQRGIKEILLRESKKGDLIEIYLKV